MTNKIHEVQLQLSLVQEEIRMHDERELLNDTCQNITATLAEIEGVCVSVASRRSNVELIGGRLLAAVSQTCVTYAEQSLEEHNNISTQLVAIQGMLTRVINFPEIFGNISKSLEIITCIIFIQIR